MRLSALRFPYFVLSLPGLTRQSMRTKSPIEFAEKLSEPQLSMDHRVKPGGDESIWRHPDAFAPREGFCLSAPAK